MNFREYLIEVGGQSAGKMEIVKTKLYDARIYAEDRFTKKLDDELPNFDKNYLFAQKAATLGKTRRKDMPVIETEDVKLLQSRLFKGEIDIINRKGKMIDEFPEGLSGKQAQYFLKNGLPMFDESEKNDDIVNTSMRKVKIKDLKPIQKQIYFDISLNATNDFGVKGTIDFLKSSIFIASSDNFIIDGHHRFLSGILIDPNMSVKVFTIDLPIRVLLPLTLAYGDAIGNKRNL